MTYDIFCLKYNLIINCNSFASIKKAFPKPTSHLIQGIVSNSTHITRNFPLNLFGKCDFIKDIKIPNKTIRKMFGKISHPLLPFRNSIKHIFSKEDIYSLRSKYLKFPINPKVKEVHFKIPNGVYPSKELLIRRLGFESD